MPRILYFHGLGGTPLSPKVSAMRARFGRDFVQAADFPFSHEALVKLVATQALHNLKGMGAALTKMGAESERIAREACDIYRPDILVGSSLGAALAMRMAADNRLPSVLLAPVWNSQIKEDYVPQLLAGRMPILRKFIVSPIFLEMMRHFTGFQFSDRVRPKTLVLHSPSDELLDLGQSVRLLANSPLPEGDGETAFMKSVTDKLVQRNYVTENRLVKVGDDHQMNDPNALRALVDAVGLLSR